jgi:hypothetical protein
MKPGKPSEYIGRANNKIHVNLDDPRGIFVLEGRSRDEITTDVLDLGGKAVEALAGQLEAGEPVIDQLLKPVPDSPGSYAVAEGVHVYISTRGRDLTMIGRPADDLPLVVREYPLPDSALPSVEG